MFFDIEIKFVNLQNLLMLLLDLSKTKFKLLTVTNQFFLLQILQKQQSFIKYKTLLFTFLFSSYI
jgi:hypothetical protein